MANKVALVLGTPGAAIVGALALWALWDALVSNEVVAPESLRYFPPIAIVWFAFCLSAGVFLYKRQKGPEK
jgi:predicted ATP-grasp superfamily ATP-dependent carboligase